MQSQVTSISREVYNAFMLFGDVGGFSGLLFTLNAIIVSIFTHNNTENYLVESLFKRAPQQSPKKKISKSKKDSLDSSDLDSEKESSDEEKLDPVKQYAFKEYL